MGQRRCMHVLRYTTIATKVILEARRKGCNSLLLCGFAMSNLKAYEGFKPRLTRRGSLGYYQIDFKGCHGRNCIELPDLQRISLGRLHRAFNKFWCAEPANHSTDDNTSRQCTWCAEFDAPCPAGRVDQHPAGRRFLGRQRRRGGSKGVAAVLARPSVISDD